MIESLEILPSSFSSRAFISGNDKSHHQNNAKIAKAVSKVSGSVIDSFRFGDSYRISELCELVSFYFFCNFQLLTFNIWKLTFFESLLQRHCSVSDCVCIGQIKEVVNTKKLPFTSTKISCHQDPATFSTCKFEDSKWHRSSFILYNIAYKPQHSRPPDSPL